MSQITVHNFFGSTKVHADLDALILSTCEWYDEFEGNCQLNVSQDDELIMMEHVHYGFNDGDTTAVIIKSELPDCVNANDLYLQLTACS
jgi:hypothetical protein